MSHYELLYLVAATFSEEELPPVKERIKEILKKYNCQITVESDLGKRKLSYPIKKYRQGYYLLVEFDAEPENILALENELRLSTDVLRHMVVIKNPRAKKVSQRAEQPKFDEQKFNEQKAVSASAKEQADEKVRLEDLDKKLDEILEGDIM